MKHALVLAPMDDGEVTQTRGVRVPVCAFLPVGFTWLVGKDGGTWVANPYVLRFVGQNSRVVNVVDDTLAVSVQVTELVVSRAKVVGQHATNRFVVILAQHNPMLHEHLKKLQTLDSGDGWRRWRGPRGGLWFMGAAGVAGVNDHSEIGIHMGQSKVSKQEHATGNACMQPRFSMSVK